MSQVTLTLYVVMWPILDHKFFNLASSKGVMSQNRSPESYDPSLDSPSDSMERGKFFVETDISSDKWVVAKNRFLESK